MELPEKLFAYVLQPLGNWAVASDSVALVCLC